jgi:LmbE family N-acetylglucosaminyl deacetylase
MDNMNILVVVAHHDDLELGCGGTVARLCDEGHRVISAVMTHSGYHGPDGNIVRDREASLKEAELASKVLGYELFSFDEDTFDMPVTDENIVKILNLINKFQIDTVFTHWHGDTHPPHKRTNTMVLHACRNVPRVLGMEINWYIGEKPFSPNFFISIDSSQWKRKIKALKCYKTEFKRAGAKWVKYLNNQTLNYGTKNGVSRAEGFVVYKYLWEPRNA